MKYLLIFIFILTTITCTRPTFDIQGDFFMKDGKPFRIIAAEMHYWRMTPEDWHARIQSAKLMGFNTINTYIYWALHETAPDVFDFTTKAIDFVAFLKAVQDEGMLAIVRVGPYITAEVDFGGFPYWLVNIPGLRIRSMEEQYLKRVDIFFDHIVPLLLPLQYGNGGPIIDIQVEDDSDLPLPDTHPYYAYLVQGLKKRGVEVLINTLCNPAMMSCPRALTPGAWLALEFEVDVDPVQAIKLTRLYYPHGPIMVMEAYPGWEDQEGQKHHTMPPEVFCTWMDKLLSSSNSSVSVYMAFGGTNFGFTNGGDLIFHEMKKNSFQYAAHTTSYDYDAPISEAGDPGTKFGPLREVFRKYVPVPSDPVPSISPKGDYGEVKFCSCSSLFEAESKGLFKQTQYVYPPNMEALGYGFGYVQYTIALPSIQYPNAVLRLASMQDRALIYIDKHVQGVLGWAEPSIPMSQTLNLTSGVKHTLDILVENKGRCSGAIYDNQFAIKGISGAVMLNEQNLSPGNWTVTHLPMSDIDHLVQTLEWKNCTENSNPTFYRSKFEVKDKILHTFLLTDGWGHGFVVINGFNIGRFSARGPQRTLYVPASILRQGSNDIVIFESDSVPPVDRNDQCRSMKFVTQPHLG